MFLDQLAYRLVAMMFEGRVVSQEFIGNILGNLLINARD
jgi:hypothetical protein